MDVPRRHRLILLLLLGVALGLRAWRLDFPHEAYFDEVYYVPAARDYLEARPDSNDVHPPLAKLELAAGMLVFDALKAWGLNPLPDEVGWRCAACLSGVGTLACAYFLALFLTGSSRAGLLTVFLLEFDFLNLVEARIATLDQIQTFWTTLGLALSAWLWKVRFSRRGLWAAGLCFGAATACKWNGLLLALGVLPCLGWRRAGPVFAASIALVYGASYLPFFWREGLALGKLWSFHLRMWTFHYDPNQFHHRYLSQFYEWPLVLRPVWYWFEQRTPGQVEGIVAIGSPLFWWLALLLMLDQLFFGWRRRDRVGRFLLLAWLAAWLPWALSTTGGFFYYMLPATPVMAVLVARELDDWWQERLSRALAAAYLGLVTAAFALYFPLLTGMGVPFGYYRLLFLYTGWN